MKAFLIITSIFVLSILLMVGSCSYFIYDGYQSFPEYAKKEVVYKKYSEYIDQLKKRIEESDSTLDLASKLEKMDHPEELIYLALEMESEDMLDDEKIDIVKKFKKGSYSTFSNGETGYGTINDVDIIIINYDISKYSDLEGCLIYLKYVADENGK